MDKKNPKREENLNLQLHIIRYTEDYFDYICDAPTGSLITDSVWRVQRIEYYDAGRTSLKEIKTAVGGYKYTAPDLATVKALTYN